MVTVWTWPLVADGVPMVDAEDVSDDELAIEDELAPRVGRVPLGR